MPHTTAAKLVTLDERVFKFSQGRIQREFVDENLAWWVDPATRTEARMYFAERRELQHRISHDPKDPNDRPVVTLQLVPV